MCNIWSCPKQAQWSGCVQTPRIMVWPVDSPQGQSTGRGLITWWVLLLADLVRDSGLINICTTFKLWCLMGGLRWVHWLEEVHFRSFTAGMIETWYDSTAGWAKQQACETLCIVSYLLRLYYCHKKNLFTLLVQPWWLVNLPFCDWDLMNNRQLPEIEFEQKGEQKRRNSDHTMLHCFENHRRLACG